MTKQISNGVKISTFHILRVGVAITFLWIGVLIFREPEAWGLYLQPWAADILPIPLKEAMIGTALLDITVGFFLLIDVLTWLAAAFGAIHLIIVLATTGINAITVRDIGLLAATIALTISAWPAYFKLLESRQIMNSSTKEFEGATLKLFKIWSLFYDSWLIRFFYFGPVYKKIIGTLEKFGSASLSPGNKFLDAACGTGEVISRLAKKYPQIEFTGVDFSKDMLKRAAAKTNNFVNVNVSQVNIRDLPFPNDSFDTVLCSDAFHHFAEPEQSLREMHRVMKEGGVLLLLDPAADTFTQKLIFKIFVEIWDRPKKYYSQKELTALLQKTGFRIETIFTYHLTNFFVCYKK